MLRLSWPAKRISCLRSFSTTTSAHLDKLSEAFMDKDDEQVPNHPPRGPPGLPRGGPSLQPASGKKESTHDLPKAPDRQDRPYHLHVFASRNNTILTLTNAVGNPLAWVSAGLCGFKKVQRSGYEAGYQCAVKMFDIVAKKKEEQHMVMRVEVLFKGFGNGREAFYRALMTTEGDKIRDTVVRFTDTTPLKIGGGTRAKKARRL